MPYWIYIDVGSGWRPVCSFHTFPEAKARVEKERALWRENAIRIPRFKVCYGAESVFETEQETV